MSPKGFLYIFLQNHLDYINIVLSLIGISHTDNGKFKMDAYNILDKFHSWKENNLDYQL